MDKRPKRRKHKDNPYVLSSDEKSNIYYVSFKDSKEKYITLEVSREIFNAFNEFELRDLSELNEYDNHIEHSEIYENTLYRRTTNINESLDDYIIRKSTYEDLINAIKKLPDVQRRRIKKYYFDGKNEYEIAKEEGTTHQSVHIILERAINNLKKILKN